MKEYAKYGSNPIADAMRMGSKLAGWQYITGSGSEVANGRKEAPSGHHKLAFMEVPCIVVLMGKVRYMFAFIHTQ